MSTLHIWVGTDPRMEKAEKALEYSVAKFATCDYEIHWMRAGDEGWEGGPHPILGKWCIGRDPGQPYSRRGWATDFTGFRWSIPEKMGFEGRAVYFDVDMLVLGDVKELLEMPVKGWRSPRRPDVIVFECSAWENFMPVHIQQERCHSQGEMKGLAGNLVHWQPLDPNWNETRALRPETKLFHYTDMRTQPWKPWPEAFSYEKPHKCPEACELFWEYYEKAVA